MPLFKALQRGDHLVAARQLRAAGIGAELALAAEPHDDHAGEYSQHHLRHQGCNQKSGALVSLDRKSTRLNSSHLVISYAVFCLKKKNYNNISKINSH